jgi:hypothetical protein
MELACAGHEKGSWLIDDKWRIVAWSATEAHRKLSGEVLMIPKWNPLVEMPALFFAIVFSNDSGQSHASSLQANINADGKDTVY